MSVGNRRVFEIEPSDFSPFRDVTSVTVALTFFPWTELADDGGRTIEVVLGFFPALRDLHVVVETDTRKTRLDALFKDGFGGKVEEVLSVALGKVPRFGIDD